MSLAFRHGCGEELASVLTQHYVVKGDCALRSPIDEAPHLHCEQPIGRSEVPRRDGVYFLMWPSVCLALLL